jgi:hypothetical protein
MYMQKDENKIVKKKSDVCEKNQNAVRNNARNQRSLSSQCYTKPLQLKPVVFQCMSDFAEDNSLENEYEERAGWGVIYKNFNMTLDEYVHHVKETGEEPKVAQLAAVWNNPPHFAATDAALVAPLAAAPNTDARFNIFMQNRTPANFTALDWGVAGHKRSIAGKLRRPAGYHEWAPVSQAPHMQANWFTGGLNYAAYQGLRTPTGATNFATTAAPGVAIPHGGPGSPGAHGELYNLVTGNATWAGFLADLDTWAVGALGSVYRAHNGTVHNPPNRGW